MGQKDKATTRYMKQNKVFADAFNFLLYNGRQVLKPEQLKELDSKEISLSVSEEKGAERLVQRTRDVIKSAVAMKDQYSTYLILAVEGQSQVNYAMPVRNMMYDTQQYQKQIEEIQKSHRDLQHSKKTSGTEYLSGFAKTDKLMPVITLVIHWGAEEWDGPLSLHEMLLEQSQDVLSYVPDYRINLLTPSKIAEEDFKKFRSTLGKVLQFIKHSENKEELVKVVEGDSAFQNLGREEIDVLNSCVNAGLKLIKEEEERDVCKAIRDLVEEAEGRGMEKGMEFILDKQTVWIKNLMRKMNWCAEEAMDFLEVPMEDRDMLIVRL